MICQNCGLDFPDKEIQLSHDVPRYIGGKDINGRHYLCKKCHDIYEKTIFAVMVKPLSDEIKKDMILRAISYAKKYFGDKRS